MKLYVYWRCGHFMRMSLVQCRVAEETPVVRESETVFCRHDDLDAELLNLKRLCDFCWNDDISRIRYLSFKNWEIRQLKWEQKRKITRWEWTQCRAETEPLSWYQSWDFAHWKWFDDNAKWELDMEEQKQQWDQKQAPHRAKWEVIGPIATWQQPDGRLVSTNDIYPYRYTSNP